MNIRNKILTSLSITTIILVGVSFLLIYILYAEYREEEFQQRQEQKITQTLRFLTAISKVEEEIIEALDKLTINELYDEKILIFNRHKELIYTSLDDTPIPDYAKIIENLSKKNPWIETKDGLYDIVGVYIEQDNKSYFGISKAFDTYGYTKLRFLWGLLIIVFFIIIVVVGIISFYLSNRISKPIIEITKKIKNYDFNAPFTRLEIKSARDEIAILEKQFNLLMSNIAEAYTFQKHFVHHVSHELKTPIAVLVSNFERMQKLEDLTAIKELIQNQKEDTKSLGEIIDALLELSKIESGNISVQTPVRIDELIFDIVGELNAIYPTFLFSITYNQTGHIEESLTITAHPSLLKSALTNILHNCVIYSNNGKAAINISLQEKQLLLDFKNEGETIRNNEQILMFKHFFRGTNSKKKRGFGLGLVFVATVLKLHHGAIHYTAGDNQNTFTVLLPLS